MAEGHVSAATRSQTTEEPLHELMVLYLDYRSRTPFRMTYILKDVKKKQENWKIDILAVQVQTKATQDEVPKARLQRRQQVLGSMLGAAAAIPAFGLQAGMNGLSQMGNSLQNGLGNLGYGLSNGMSNFGQSLRNGYYGNMGAMQNSAYNMPYYNSMHNPYSSFNQFMQNPLQYVQQNMWNPAMNSLNQNVLNPAMSGLNQMMGQPPYGGGFQMPFGGGMGGQMGFGGGMGGQMPFGGGMGGQFGFGG